MAEQIERSIKRKNKTPILILGNPNIGKTQSSSLLLRYLFKQEEIEKSERIFVYAHGKELQAWAFQYLGETWRVWKTKIPMEPFSTALTDDNNIYLVNQNIKSPSIPGTGAGAYQIIETSPNLERFGETVNKATERKPLFFKEDFDDQYVFYLNPWSKDEFYQVVEYRKKQSRNIFLIDRSGKKIL